MTRSYPTDLHVLLCLYFSLVTYRTCSEELILRTQVYNSCALWVYRAPIINLAGLRFLIEIASIIE